MPNAQTPSLANLAGLRTTATLNHGPAMPWLGLGVWQIESDRETERVVRTAIEAGYRSIDTARIYGNERGVGLGIRNCGVPREQLFITTKVWNDDVRSGRIKAAFEQSLRLLQLDYLDLYLVHWPIRGQLVAAWKAMEGLLRDGRVKAIGVSNYLRADLDETLQVAEVVPAVNQIEFHPYLQSRALVNFCREKHIQVQAWSPLFRGGELLADPAIVAIAKRCQRTPAQVVLRWEIQTGVITIPKSSHAGRIAENGSVFDFTLPDADMAVINGLEQNRRCGPDPANFAF